MSEDTGLKRRNYGRGHGYTLDGAKVVGVTTAISGGLPKPALQWWAARTVAEYVADRLQVDKKTGHIYADELVDDLQAMNAAKTTQKPWRGRLPRAAITWVLAGVPQSDATEAAVRGTDVHRLAERFIRGERVNVPEALVPYVDRYAAFLEAFAVEEEHVEFTVASRRWKYAGQGDLIATLTTVDGRHRWLLDIKTSRSGVYGETGLQLAGYGHADFVAGPDGEELPMPAIDRYGVVWVRPDGCDLVPFDVGDREFRQFLYCLQTHLWVKDRDSKDAPAPIKGDAIHTPKPRTSRSA